MLKKTTIDDNYEGRVFVISDIHGMLDLFTGIIKKIDLNKSALLIIAGDSCDRGLKTNELYEQYITMQKSGYNIIHLIGNHERMFYDYKVFGINEGLWMQNGGDKTLKSYKGDEKSIDKHLEFIENMVHFVEYKNYIITHAGIDFLKSIEKQNEDDLIWGTESFNNSYNTTDKIIIFGHTINKSGLISYFNNNTIGIDVGGYKNRRLAILELKKEQEFYYTG